MLGYILQIDPNSSAGSTLVHSRVLASTVTLLVKSAQDYLTVNEIYNWEIYKPTHPLKSKIKVALDLGANIGLASVYFDAALDLTTIISVEPLESVQSNLKVNLASIKAKLNIIESCIVPDEFSFNKCMMDTSKGSRYASISTSVPSHLGEEVKAVNCSNFIEKIKAIAPEPDIIKIDIEGFGCIVARQLLSKLQKSPLNVFIEEDEAQLVDLDFFMNSKEYLVAFRMEGFRTYELKGKSIED